MRGASKRPLARGACGRFFRRPLAQPLPAGGREEARLPVGRGGTARVAPTLRRARQSSCCGSSPTCGLPWPARRSAAGVSGVRPLTLPMLPGSSAEAEWHPSGDAVSAAAVTRSGQPRRQAYRAGAKSAARHRCPSEGWPPRTRPGPPGATAGAAHRASGRGLETPAPRGRAAVPRGMLTHPRQGEAHRDRVAYAVHDTPGVGCPYLLLRVAPRDHAPGGGRRRREEAQSSPRRLG